MTTEKKKDFFISYNGQDKNWAEWIAWQLEETGYSVVIQAWDFRPGGNFVLEMQKAAQADRTLVVLSPNYLAAEFTQPEWATAFAQDPKSEKKTLLPVRIAECEPLGLLKPIIFIDLVGLEEAVAKEKLLTGIEPGSVRPHVPPLFPGWQVQAGCQPPRFPLIVSGRPDSAQPTPQISQTEFTEQVRQEIDKLFTDRQIKLRALRDGLLQQAAVRQPYKAPPVNPADLLVPRQAAFDVKTSIDDLHGVVETCVRQLIDQGSSAVPDIVSGATDVLGWLVLLAVSETWLQEQAGLLDRLLSADHIAIPLETDVGTEVVFARLRAKKPAKLTLGNDGVQISNPNRLEWAELELGISRTDRMTEIHKLIWKAVMKSDTLNFGQGELKQLKDTLEIRYERGENYYIIIRAHSNSSSVAIDSALLIQLRRDFPHLCAFLIGIEAGEEVLVIPETRLVVLVREFLLMLRKYKP